MGGHKRICDCCDTVVYTYHSCKDRHCPKCGSKDTEKWAGQQELKLLDTHYFHVVLTIPHELGEIVRQHQKIGYNILFDAAAYAMKKVMKKQLFGDELFGFMAVLHTWTRALSYHPHVHLLVPGGAWNKGDKCWTPTPSSMFLIPEKALSSVFRAVFVKMMRRVLPENSIPQKVFAKDWVVKVLPALSHKKSVLSYLSRYVKKTAITNNRILAGENGTVTFRYQDNKTRQWKTMTLPAIQFMSRFLQHVLPKGFTKIRHYGLLTPANREYLSLAQVVLSKEPCSEVRNGKKAESNREIVFISCPHCKKGHLVILCELLKNERGPPW